jgi:hypothetical protein
MGASYYAYAVIGVEVTGKLHTITKRPSCAHQPSGAFCSTCGKPNKAVEVETPIASYDEDRGTIGTLRVVHTTDNKKSFVGIAVDAGDLNYSDANHKRLALSPFEIASRVDDLRRQLTEIGLWDESSFGLWAVGYCSY